MTARKLAHMNLKLRLRRSADVDPEEVNGLEEQPCYACGGVGAAPAGVRDGRMQWLHLDLIGCSTRIYVRGTTDG